MADAAGAQGAQGVASDSPVTEMRRYAIERLTLTDFRSYTSLRIEAGGQPVVLTGVNGAGKTNILEAISLLVPGRGLRRARMSELACDRGPGDWAVAAQVSTPDGKVTVGTGFVPDGPGRRERRLVRIDGETVSSQAELARHMGAHWLTPQMDRLFSDGVSARRRFLDRLVYAWDPAHAGRVQAFEQSMRERLKLLKERKSPDAGWLKTVEDGMAERGVAVAAARRDLIARLAPPAAAGLGPFPGALLALQGELDDWLDDGPALQAEDRYRSRLAADRARDQSGGRTHSGPHRTDLVVRHGAKGKAAALCSTGEQKALLIAIVLANAALRGREDGGVPVLLLDEVAAHLDEMRREALFAHLLSLGAQVWLTGTDDSLFGAFKNRAQHFEIDNNGLKPNPN
ncbi:MAG: DNA replication/repair protein RecF [Rhodospirillales bacterium]|nr:DNA replication/repair protein RecF [Rhodospirillales bacterium]